jgi:hypothetical protein
MTEKKPEYKNVAEVLHFIQKNLKAPKGQLNKFGGYHYRSCEDIVEAVKGILPAGATLKINDDIVMVGNRFYVKATATLCFNGECESVTAFARESESKKGMDDAQLTGATSSYARKYALNGLFMIDDTKDADATNDHGKGEKTEPKAKPEATPEQNAVVDWLKTVPGELKALDTYTKYQDWTAKNTANMSKLNEKQIVWINKYLVEASDRLTPLSTTGA